MLAFRTKLELEKTAELIKSNYLLTMKFYKSIQYTSLTQ